MYMAHLYANIYLSSDLISSKGLYSTQNEVTPGPGVFGSLASYRQTARSTTLPHGYQKEIGAKKLAPLIHGMISRHIRLMKLHMTGCLLFQNMTQATPKLHCSMLHSALGLFTGASKHIIIELEKCTQTFFVRICQILLTDKIVYSITTPRHGRFMQFPAILTWDVTGTFFMTSFGAPAQADCSRLTGRTWVVSISSGCSMRFLSWMSGIPTLQTCGLGWHLG